MKVVNQKVREWGWGAWNIFLSEAVIFTLFSFLFFTILFSALLANQWNHYGKIAVKYKKDIIQKIMDQILGQINVPCVRT